MKNLVQLLIGQNEHLLQYHQTVMQHHKETLHALTKILERYSEPNRAIPERDKNENPDFLSQKEESVLAHRILSLRAEAAGAEPGVFALPKHVSITFVTTYLDISSSTFYRQVKDKLLTAVLRIGNRPYYLLSELHHLFQHVVRVKHEKGAWTFARINEKLVRSKT